MTDKCRILVVDDDSDVRWMIRKYLEKHDFAVDAVEDGARMRAILEEQSYDLIILDVTMPGEDGLSLARFLRENFELGIIMVTAASEVVDRVLGLEMGADDYITKPFEPRELLARIKSVLRRSAAPHSPQARAGAASAPAQVRFGQVVLDLDTHKLLNAEGEEIQITSMEFDLLKAFADNPNKVLTRDQLLNLAHNRDWDPFDRSIDIRIARIRRKIEPDPSKPQIIKTVRGAGYIFAADSGGG
jgi:DNA-binding response OmpR family regulator